MLVWFSVYWPFVSSKTFAMYVVVVLFAANLSNLFCSFQIILLFLSTYAAEELVEGNKTASLKEINRDKRQIQTKVERTSPDLSGIQQGCRIEGYETREREICEEITERVCLVCFITLSNVI